MTPSPYKRRRRQAGYPTGYSTTVATGPPTLIRKLRYSDSVQMAPTATPSNYFFHANGLFDPDETGSGHQPMGFDQYMALYDHYKVLGSKITVTFAQAPADSLANNVICAIYLDDDITAVTDIHAAIEQGVTKWAQVNSTSVKPTKISKTFSAKKFFSDAKYSSAQIVGASGGNPTEQAMFNIIVAPLDGISNPTDFYVHVVIDYIVQFSERKTLVSS